MVAAHNDDLKAARPAACAPCSSADPHEHGPAQTTDLAPAERWDVVVDSLTEAANALGCPEPENQA